MFLEQPHLQQIARYSYFFLTVLRRLAAVLLILLSSAGCQKVAALPPQVTVTEIEPSGRAAKSPDCNIPVLRAEPIADYRKVAIIEGLGNVFGQESDVLPIVVRKACETGADALVVLVSKAQTSENMTGYYINAVAINYLKGRGVIKAPEARPKP